MVFSGLTSFFGSGAGTGVGAAADFGGEMASGGLITGGSGNRDDVPILAMGGEFVLNKRAAQNIGYSTLHALNSMSNVRHYADGGVVNGPGSSGIYAGGGGGYVHNSNVQIHIDNTGNMKVDAEEQGKQSAGLAEALEGLLEQRLQDKFRSGAMFNPVSGKYTR
jgi:phage-related minor tail protein